MIKKIIELFQPPYLKYFFGLMIIAMGVSLVFLENQNKKNIIYSVQTRKNVVALTFDDGPHPVYTNQLLEILNKYQVKATFFMIGTLIEKYPYVVKQMIANGHSIGNHTYSHPVNLTKCSKRQIIEELNNCNTILRKFIHQPVVIFRPPRGLFDKEVVQIAKEKGYQTILWSICGNSRNAGNPELMAKRVTENIHAGDIILLHDGRFDSRWKDVAATQLIIENLLIKGFQFVTVPQLLELSRN